MSLAKCSATRILIACLGASVLAAGPSFGQGAPSPSVPSTAPIVATPMQTAEIIEVAVARASQQADAWGREREGRIWTTLAFVTTLVLGLFGFIGIKSIPDLRRTVVAELAAGLHDDRMVTNAIDKSIDACFDKRVAPELQQLQQDFVLYRFWAQANELADMKWLSESTRDELVETIAQFSNTEVVLKKKLFLDALEKVIDAFALAQLDADIDRIDDTLGTVAQRVPGIVQTMVIHYGLRTLGQVQLDELVLNRFQKYCTAAKATNRWEYALPFVLADEFDRKESDWSKRIDEYLLDIGDFDESEKQVFARQLRRSTIVGGTETGTALTKRVKTKMRTFVAQYDSAIPPVSAL